MTSKELDILPLGKKQRAFTRMIGNLIVFAYSKGYELSLGDAYRDPRVFGDMGTTRGYGRASSNHKLRLAIDFNLFKDGKYLRATEDYIELGEYWESIGGCWGGRFNDGNHFSVVHNGRR